MPNQGNICGKLHECPVCGAAYFTRETMKDHLQEAHVKKAKEGSGSGSGSGWGGGWGSQGGNYGGKKGSMC